jgi:hypothetical protein
VLNGEGVATKKWDGSGCLVRDGKLYKRYEVKKGKKAPADFEPACEVDPNTGKQQGWRPVGDGPDDKWFREAFDAFKELCEDLEAYGGGAYGGGEGRVPDGTYELCGPKVQSNREGLSKHLLIPHGQWLFLNIPLTYDALEEWLAPRDIEGIVWWHPDGRMVKLRKADFGLPRVAGQRIS